MVRNGTPYIGSSAGSVIVGPSIEPVKTLDDPAAAPGLKSHEGLHLISQVILPHAGNPKYERRYQQIIDAYRGHTIIPITDAQAVIVTQGRTRIIECAT